MFGQVRVLNPFRNLPPSIRLANRAFIDGSKSITTSIFINFNETNNVPQLRKLNLHPRLRFGYLILFSCDLLRCHEKRLKVNK